MPKPLKPLFGPLCVAIVASLTLATHAFAQDSGSCQPPNYCAVTSTVQIPFPSPTPEPPPVGGIYTETAFSVPGASHPIVRVTDENFDPAFPGESLWTPNASQRNTCSADGKYCYIEGPSFRTYLLSVSWPSGSAAPSFQSLGQIPGGGVTCRTSVFSFTDPDTLYCLDVGSPKIWQYSVSKKTLTLLVDPLASCPGLAAHFPAGERE